MLAEVPWKVVGGGVRGEKQEAIYVNLYGRFLPPPPLPYHVPVH